MNYLTEIQAFYDSLDICPLSSSHISLWIALFQLCNRNNWSEWFAPKTSVLESYSGLSRASIIRNREDLINAGYIKYQSKGTTSGEYKIIPCINRCINPCFKMIQDVKQGEIQEVIQADDIYNNINNNILNKTKTKTPPISPEGDVAELFKKFWLAYPKKACKQDAEKSFYKINPNDELLDQIIKAIQRQAKAYSWTKGREQYIPNASTWLNQKRWLDDADAKPQEEIKWLN